MKELLLLLLAGILSECWSNESFGISKCNLEPDSGWCSLHVEKIFYNSSSNQCETFFFNGCGGNENKFESKNDCERSCMRPPVDEIGDGLEDDQEEEEVDEINKPSATLFGKLFQKSLLTTSDLFKPDFMFGVFGPNKSKRMDNGDDDDDEDNKEVEEEQIKEDNTDEGEEGKRNPGKRFASIFDFLRPKIKPGFNLFGSSLTGRLFTNFWSETMNTFRERIDRSFAEMAKGVEKSIIPTNTMECYACKKFVNIVEYELNVLKMSIKYILQTVQFICKFFPFADKICEIAVSDIKIIIKYIEEGLSPESICEDIKLCNSTLPEGVTQTVSIVSSHKCAPLCNFMKVAQEEKVMKISQSWNATRIKLKRFCDDNKIIKKCDIFFRMLGKSFGHLSSITAKQNEEHCKCFKRQPMFDTKKFDSCLRCKQFKSGMINELKQVNQSILSLASRVKDLCKLFPTQVCTNIVNEFMNSLENNTATMPNICTVTGHCENTEKKNILVDRIEESFSKLRSIIPDPKSMMMRRMGLNLRNFSPDCLFCKKCMGDLKETFNNINETEIASKSIYPAVKEGFGIYCQTRSVGKDFTTLCRKISDGIERVHKMITKQGNEQRMCKILGVC